MTRRELALLQTARSTHVCLDRFEDSWANLLEFSEKREVIRQKMAELEELAGEAGADRGNLAGQRQQAIQALAEDTWVTAGQVQAWAAIHGEEEVRRSVSATRDELVWLQMSLPERALEIHQRALECTRSGNGEAVGLSASRLDRLSERIQALKILRVPPPSRRAEVVDADAFSGILNHVMDLLCEVIDPLMRRFHAEAPEFYAAYQVARRVVDPETGTLLTSDEEWAGLDDILAVLPGEVAEALPAAGRRPVAPQTGASRGRSKRAALDS